MIEKYAKIAAEMGGELKQNKRSENWYIEKNNLIIAKLCKKCAKILDLADYAKQKSGLGGRNAICKDCKAGRSYSQGDIEAAVEFSGKLRRGKKGTIYVEVEGGIFAKKCGTCNSIKVLDDFFYSKHKLGNRESSCKSCRGKYVDEWMSLNKEFHKSMQRDWYARNRESVAEYGREYRKENFERNRSKNIRWYQANKDKALEGSRIRRMKRPHIDRAVQARRRARIALLPSDLTSVQFKEIMEHFSNSCAITGASSDVHLDHVVPISTGYGGTTFENMIPLYGRLNESKNGANIFSWFNRNRQRFSLDQTRFNALIKYLADINNMTIFEYTAYVYECHNNPRDLTELVTLE